MAVENGACGEIDDSALVGVELDVIAMFERLDLVDQKKVIQEVISLLVSEVQ